MGIKFRIKQYMKMLVQNVYLPRVYQRACRKPVQPGTVIFADAHSRGITPSMTAVYNRLLQDGYTVKDLCVDFAELSMGKLISYMKHFMQEYAEAEYVFLSSYFLPVSSCKKRKETKVIQLWHSGGLMKKMGYDAKDDIPPYYKGHVAANYDLVTVSADICIPVWARALGLSDEHVKATGLARTDIYYDESYNRQNVEKFYKVYPEARGRRICIYAPTFSGNAGSPECAGLTSGISEVFQQLSDDWFFVIKLHPHLMKQYPEYQCSLKTEELFAAADLLITDYSSVLFDYLIYGKPFILYAPDLAAYQISRGLYVDYYSFPAPVAVTPGELLELFLKGAWRTDEESLRTCFEQYMGCCDGHALERILQEAGIETQKRRKSNGKKDKEI